MALLARRRAGGNGRGGNDSIYFVGCAAPTGFHGYLARGAAEAGKNLGVKVTYIYPDQLTIPNQVEKIEEAIAAKANGIALCEFARGFRLCRCRRPRQGGGDRLRQRGRAAGRRAGPRSQRHFPVPHRIRREGRGRADRQTAHRHGRQGRRRRRRPAAWRRDLPRSRRAGNLRRSRPPASRRSSSSSRWILASSRSRSSTICALHPDTQAATSVCDVIDGFLSRQGRQRAKGLDPDRVRHRRPVARRDQGRAAGVHDRPAAVLARLHARCFC